MGADRLESRFHHILKHHVALTLYLLHHFTSVYRLPFSVRSEMTARKELEFHPWRVRHRQIREVAAFTEQRDAPEDQALNNSWAPPCFIEKSVEWLAAPWSFLASFAFNTCSQRINIPSVESLLLNLSFTSIIVSPMIGDIQLPFLYPIY